NRKHAAQRVVRVRRAGLQLAFHLAVDDEQVDATLKADEQSNREQHQNRVADGATETDFLHETRLLDEQFQQVAAMRINAEKHKAVAAGIEQVGSTARISAGRLGTDHGHGVRGGRVLEVFPARNQVEITYANDLPR